MHPAAGGAEKHLHRIFGKIVEMGHTVVLFTTTFPGAKEREVVDGIQVIRKGGDLMFQLTVALNLKKLDREFNFDVVVEDLNKLPVFAHWFVRKPLLVQMHHLWRKSIFAEAIFPIAFMVWFFERIIPFFYRTQNFVVVSPSTKKELAEIGVDESRISVIYNGSEMPNFPGENLATSAAESCENAANPVTSAANPYFIWLSRVHRYKGIWTALEAFEKFSTKHPEVKLYVVGDGPLLKKLPTWIQSHGLDGKVELTGFVSAARKYELLSSSLALLQTSYKEGWGLTVMEAAQLCKTTIRRSSARRRLRRMCRDSAIASVTARREFCSRREMRPRALLPWKKFIAMQNSAQVLARMPSVMRSRSAGKSLPAKRWNCWNVRSKGAYENEVESEAQVGHCFLLKAGGDARSRLLCLS